MLLQAYIFTSLGYNCKDGTARSSGNFTFNLLRVGLPALPAWIRLFPSPVSPVPFSEASGLYFHLPQGQDVAG